MKNYLHKDAAKDALLTGIQMVNDAVAPTMGPAGRDAVLAAFEWPYSIITNDGASIAERVKSDDEFEQMGVRLIQEAIGRANKESGDGSTTTCVLTAALLEKGFENPALLKEELNNELPTVLESIDKQTKTITPEEAWKVATVSAQDEEMGKMIGEIYQQIGADGVIDWDNSHTQDTFYEIKEGVELKNVTYLHHSFINAGPKGSVSNPMLGDRIVVNNPHILISAEKVHTSTQLEPYVSALKREGIREMVLFVDEIEPLALAEIEATGLGFNPRTRQPVEPFKVIVLKAPTLWRDWIIEDFAKMTGATVFGIGLEAQFKGGASLKWLGTCDKIIVRRNGTDVIGTKDISAHMDKLREQAKDHGELEKRIEWLNSRAAVVKMGARSEVELTHKRLKFEDAKNAAKLALKHGVVLGGGIALRNASEEVSGETMRYALNAPMRTIEKNGAKIDEKELETNGIYDPAIVVKNAVSAAVSVASTVLNCETLVPLNRE